MLHLWTILLLVFCAGLATVALLRGLAGLLVGRGALARLEAAALTLVGLAGWIGLLIVRRGPG